MQSSPVLSSVLSDVQIEPTTTDPANDQPAASSDVCPSMLDGSTALLQLRDAGKAATRHASSRPTASQAASHTAIQKDRSETTPNGRVHDGGAVYFESIEGRVTESTKAYPQTSAVFPADIAALQCYQAFELPPRSTKACYIDNFFKYCYPWLPVAEPAWLRETPTRKPSILLQQAVLLAGSRVATPHDLDASREFYARTKALSFSNYEQNPVIRIITCLLMRWWNPAGPDRVCMDSSHVWISTGVSLVVAIGLHADNPQSRDTCYRRRLWWTLMVSEHPTLLLS
jgi:hypothetical protein